MGYIGQTDVGNVYVTDINDWFATLSNLNSECKNYTDSEIRYKEILTEHDKQIRAEVIEEYNKSLKEHWIEEDDLGLSDDFFKYVDKIAEQLKERVNESSV